MFCFSVNYNFSELRCSPISGVQFPLSITTNTNDNFVDAPNYQPLVDRSSMYSMKWGSSNSNAKKPNDTPTSANVKGLSFLLIYDFI